MTKPIAERCGAGAAYAALLPAARAVLSGPSVSAPGFTLVGDRSRHIAYPNGGKSVTHDGDVAESRSLKGNTLPSKPPAASRNSKELAASSGLTMMRTADTDGRYCVATRDVTDAWQHSQSPTDWSHLYNQVKPGRFSAHTSEVWLGALQVIHERVDHAFSYRGRPWEGSRIFQISLPIQGELYHDGRRMPGNILTTRRWDSTDRIFCNGSAECVIIAIDEILFAHNIEQVLGYPPFVASRHSLVLSSDQLIVDRFRNCVLNLLREVNRQPDLLVGDHSREFLQKYVLELLLDVLTAQRPAVDRLPRPSTRAYIVGKAVEFIEARLAEPLTLSDICLALRVSPRTLRYSFAEIVGVSPMRYLSAHRLNGARRDFLQFDRERTVEEIALSWGFQHMGRFAHYYRLTFGERPTSTSRGVHVRQRQFRRDQRSSAR